MPTNLMVDGLVAAVSKSVVTGYRKRVEDVLEKLGRSDLNEFGQGAVITAAQITPLAAGQVIEYAGDAVPSGFLECNGAEVPRANFPDLFAAIGTAYGDAQAAADFVLPDLRGASVMGAGGTYVAGPGVAVGSTHPIDTVTLVAGNLPRHDHAVAVDSAAAGSHAHGWTRYPTFTFNAGGPREGDPDGDDRWGAGVSYGERTDGATTALAGSHTHAITGSIEETGEGTAMLVKQPSVAMLMLIKT